MIHGRDLIVTLNSQYPTNNVLAAAKSCSVGVDTDFIEVANPSEGSWREYRPTIHGWSISVDMLFAKAGTFNTLFNYQTNKTLLTLRFFDAEMGMFYKGSAYIKNLKADGSVGSLAKLTCDFQTSGALVPASSEDIDCTLELWHGRIFTMDEYGISSIDDADNDGIMYKQLTFTAARTMVYLEENCALIKETAANLETLVGHYQDDVINREAVLVCYGKSGSVIVGPGTYTVIVNYWNQTSQADGYYRSSF